MGRNKAMKEFKSQTEDFRFDNGSNMEPLELIEKSDVARTAF